MCLQFAPRGLLSTWPKISNSHAVIACPECRCSDVGQTAQHVVTSWNWCSGNIIGCYTVARALWKAIWGRPGALPLSVNILHTPPALAQLTAIATAMLHVATLFIWRSWMLWSILKVVMEVNMEERIDHPSRGTWLWWSHYRSLLYCVILQTRRYSTKEISNKGASDCLKCTHVYFPTILNENLWPEKPGLPPFILEGAGKDCLGLEEQRSGEEGAGPKFGEITPLAPHLAIPHHPPGLTLFQTQVHASFAPFSQ